MTQLDLALLINSGERFIVDLESGKETCQIGKALAAAAAVGLHLTPEPSSQRLDQDADEETGYDIEEISFPGSPRLLTFRSTTTTTSSGP